MRNIIETITVAVALVAATLEVEAASTTVNTPAGNTPTIVVSNSCKSVQFIFNNTNLVAFAYHTLFDAPAATTATGLTGASITNVVGSYTWVSLSTSLITNVYTSYFGVAYATNVQYSAVVHTTNTIAQTTNLYPIALQIIVPTNSTLTIDFNQTFIRGILDTNSGAGSVTAVYSQ